MPSDHPAFRAHPTNRLLAALPDDEFARLHPSLNTIALRRKQPLYQQGERIRHVYFPNGGVCVVTVPTSSGMAIQAVSVGDEGMVGIEAFFTDEPKASGETFVQVATTGTDAQRLGLAEFRRILALAGALYRTVGRYAQATFAVIVQLVACNTSHRVEQRCARCLLNVHDSVRADEFNLTHDDLASLLGVARPTLTECASKLQAKGLIRCSRGRIVVLDRPGLETVACECYAINRAHLNRVIHPERPTSSPR